MKQRDEEPLAVTEERPGTGTPVLPVLVPLAAKQSVKARFLYYCQLIGFSKVKCTSHPGAMTRVWDRGAEPGRRRARRWRQKVAKRRMGMGGRSTGMRGDSKVANISPASAHCWDVCESFPASTCAVVSENIAHSILIIK